MKLKLIFITVLAFASMAHAQGILSNLSIGAGFEGIFPAATFDHNVTSPFESTAQKTTNSVGIVAGARYDFGRHSALDISFTGNRDTEYFYNGFSGFVSRVQTNNLETIGSYVFRLPVNEHVKPYALFGGGFVRFSPNNNFTSATPSVETKPAFAYGFGTDFKFTDHWALRLQYRGLLRADPDFGLFNSNPGSANPFGTGLRSHVAEPSIQAVYHF